MVQFAPEFTVVIVPPWKTKLPVTTSNGSVGLVVAIASLPPSIYGFGDEPSWSCCTHALHVPLSPAFPAAVPAKQPSVDVNAYS